MSGAGACGPILGRDHLIIRVWEDRLIIHCSDGLNSGVVLPQSSSRNRVLVITCSPSQLPGLTTSVKVVSISAYSCPLSVRHASGDGDIGIILAAYILLDGDVHGTVNVGGVLS